MVRLQIAGLVGRKSVKHTENCLVLAAVDKLVVCDAATHLGTAADRAKLDAVAVHVGRQFGSNCHTHIRAELRSNKRIARHCHVERLTHVLRQNVISGG